MVLYEHITLIEEQHHTRRSFPYSLSELFFEVVKDEVREGLGHGTHIGDVMPHHGAGEREGGCGSIGEVAYHKTICRVGKRDVSEQTSLTGKINNRDIIK